MNFFNKKLISAVSAAVLAALLPYAGAFAGIGITLTNQIPASVDNSKKQFFRPIFDQQGESCGNAAGIGYTFTYELDRARNLVAKDSVNQYPYIYTYAFLNDGSDLIGNSRMYVDALTICKENGIPGAVDWGGFQSGFPTKWMSGYDLYYTAMHNRVDALDSISVLDSLGLRKLKQWIYDHGSGSADGGVANLGCSVSMWQFSTISSGPEIGKSICISYGADSSGDHAQTIVGYNDSIRFDFNKDALFTNNKDINGDGKVTMADWEVGALRIANSWGGQIGDGDFYWLPYRFLAMSSSAGGIRNGNRVCFVTVKKDYKPKMALKISLTHSHRNQIGLSVGIAPLAQAAAPTKKRKFSRQFTFSGGDFPMCGQNASSNIELGFDVSDLLDSIPASASVTVFLIVESRTASAGTVQSVSLMDYTTGALQEIKSAQSNVPIAANAVTYVGVSAGGWGMTIQRPVAAYSDHAFSCRRVNGQWQIRGAVNGAQDVTLLSLGGSCIGAIKVHGTEWGALPKSLQPGTYILLPSSGRSSFPAHSIHIY